MYLPKRILDYAINSEGTRRNLIKTAALESLQFRVGDCGRASRNVLAGVPLEFYRTYNSSWFRPQKLSSPAASCELLQPVLAEVRAVRVF